MNNYIICYAWEYNNSWFISQKRQVMPKNSFLRMKLKCENTTMPINTKTTYPTIDDVVEDINGNKLLVLDILI